MTKKGNYNKRLFSLISILVSIFVYTGAIAIYFYANGWRLGDTTQPFIKTGVLTVESEPFLANLYVNGKEKGKTPKSVSLPIGVYDVSLYKSGYIEWRKNIEIKEQKSTPVYPWLIKEQIEKQQNFILQGKKYINSWINEYDSHIYFLVNEYIPETLIYRYSLYRFDTNTAFWDMASNPRVVLTFDLAVEPNIEISLSPNGLYGVLTIIDTTATKYYLLDSTKSSSLDTLTELYLSVFSSYSMTWSKNNQYLIFESSQDLISFDITKQTRYLLIKKVEGNEYIWNTDQQGFFYKIDVNPEYQLDDVNAYILVQQQMDGSAPNTIIRDLFFQKNQDYILRYMQDTGDGKYLPFTNSPESTKSVGKIKGFVVNQDAKGVFIQSDISSYWYSIDSKKYYLVSPYFSELIEFSHDNYKLLFKDIQGYSVFTFEKENGDHTAQIGAKRIDGLDQNISNVNWLFNSLNISYIQDKTMYIADKEGENKTKILDSTDTNIFQIVTPSAEKIVTLSLGQETEGGIRDISINSYLIH